MPKFITRTGRVIWCSRAESLTAGINAALDAFEEMRAEATAATRAVVSDDGSQIRLTLYGETGAVAEVALDPCRAITIAGRLINAVGLRLRP